MSLIILHSTPHEIYLMIDEGGIALYIERSVPASGSFSLSSTLWGALISKFSRLAHLANMTYQVLTDVSL